MGPDKMAVFDAQARNFGTGVNTSNFAPITATVLQKFTANFPADNACAEMPVFIERLKNSKELGLKYEYEVASWPALNRYLVATEGRLTFGRDVTSERLDEAYGFAGSFNATIPGYKRRDGGTECALIVGRRARLRAFTRAFSDKKSKTADNMLSSVYCLNVRRELIERDFLPIASSITSSSNIAADASAYNNNNNTKTNGREETYWDKCIFVDPAGGAPPDWLYIDDESIGSCRKIGTVNDFAENNTADPKMTQRARQSLDGRHNAITTDNDYKTLSVLLPSIDLVMNT